MKSFKNKRFGTVAVEKGLISREQLEQALAIQSRENLTLGWHRLIGQILVSEGWLRQEQVEDILNTMSNKMVLTIGVGR